MIETGSISAADFVMICVLNIQTASFSMELPDDFRKQEEEEGHDTGEFADYMLVTFTNIDGQSMQTLIEVHLATQLAIDLAEWSTSMHEMGRCGCDEGEEHRKS